MQYELWLTKKPVERFSKPKQKPIMRIPITLKRTSRVSSLICTEIHIPNKWVANRLNKYPNFCIVDVEINTVLVPTRTMEYNAIKKDTLCITWDMEFFWAEEKWLRDVCLSELVSVKGGEA